jgi:hypothetical protein
VAPLSLDHCAASSSEAINTRVDSGHRQVLACLLDGLLQASQRGGALLVDAPGDVGPAVVSDVQVGALRWPVAGPVRDVLVEVALSHLGRVLRLAILLKGEVRWQSTLQWSAEAGGEDGAVEVRGPVLPEEIGFHIHVATNSKPAVQLRRVLTVSTATCSPLLGL